MDWTPGFILGFQTGIIVSVAVFVAVRWLWRRADARLIAAAPEMLKALEALERQALQSDVNLRSNEWGQEALAMARAAITKATA